MYLGFDWARSNDVEPHTIPCPLTGEGFDHGLYSRLGSCTGNNKPRASLSIRGSDGQEACPYTGRKDNSTGHTPLYEYTPCFASMSLLPNSSVTFAVPFSTISMTVFQAFGESLSVGEMKLPAALLMIMWGRLPQSSTQL